MRDAEDCFAPGAGGGDLLMGLMHLMAPVTQELWDRMDGEVSGKDRLAITTALTKAVEVGMLHGAGEVAALALEGGVEIALPPAAGDLDLWDQAYGSGRD